MSDSHSLIPKQIYSFFEDVDLILHCGDIGSSDALCELRVFKPTIAVWGNCDSRYELEDVEEFQSLEIENHSLHLFLSCYCSIMISSINNQDFSPAERCHFGFTPRL